ncbi:zinc finger CCCH domain-containing protein 12-like isoform X2 [Benincasa hispida]|uniref:zinc finger CCCH domain-containing protein 12-like isoform X2 n=1 Tax=Benincasa hispida TaxID=102211 RepID=UPI00190154C0|nr:zinc finger CCCH domain-containing protein 12-like isoform X2 [Benincasa hispida]
MSAPNRFVPEARGDWRPLPPYPDARLQSFHQPTMSETVSSWGMPSNIRIPPWNNRNVGYDHELDLGRLYTPGFNDTHRRLPSTPGIEFHEGQLSERSIVDCRTGTSNEMKVCRQFQRRRKCAYGDQCRFLHEIPEKTREFGSSSQNYEVRAVASGHVVDRRSGFDQLEEVRSKVQTKIVVRGEIPKPLICKTRPCYPWQTTGRCPYGAGCRFAHGEAGIDIALVFFVFGENRTTEA